MGEIYFLPCAALILMYNQGVFPSRPIQQPTVVEACAFRAWKQEAYELGSEWAACYDPNSRSCVFLNDVFGTYYLMNVVW